MAHSWVPIRGLVIKVTLLLPWLFTGLAQAQVIAPNPGGQPVVTNSTTSTYVDVDTPVSQRVDDYSTTITAILNGGPTVFDQTFALPFSDPTVQAAVLDADAILAADKATFGSPSLVSSSTTLQSSNTVDLSGGPDTADGNTTVTTTDTFGPNTVMVGDNQSEEFIILAGQLDINVNTNVEYAVPVNVVTTDTYLTTQSYNINGVTSSSSSGGGGGSSAPLPAGAWQALIGLMFLGLIRIGFTAKKSLRK